MNKYYENYKIKELKKYEESRNKQKYIFGSLVVLLVLAIIGVSINLK